MADVSPPFETNRAEPWSDLSSEAGLSVCRFCFGKTRRKHAAERYDRPCPSRAARNIGVMVEHPYRVHMRYPYPPFEHCRATPFGQFYLDCRSRPNPTPNLSPTLTPIPWGGRGSAGAVVRLCLLCFWWRVVTKKNAQSKR